MFDLLMVLDEEVKQLQVTPIFWYILKHVWTKSVRAPLSPGVNKNPVRSCICFGGE